MSSVSQKRILFNVLNGIIEFTLLCIFRVKSLLPLNFIRINKNYIIDILDSHIVHYASPINLTYA